MIGQSCVNKDGGCSTLSLSEESACCSLFRPFARRRRGKASKTKSERVMIRQWISRREERGVIHQLIRELEVGDVVAYKEFFRMTKEHFAFCWEKYPADPKERATTTHQCCPPCFFLFLICRVAALR